MNQAEHAVEMQNLELSIADAKKKIARMECLERLQKNQDFIDLIEKGFMETHAIRQVMLKAHPSLQSDSAQKLLDAQINAIGNFKQFLIAVFTEGQNAKAALEADEQTREEMLKEALGHDDE